MPGPDEDPGDLFDYAKIRDQLVYVLHSVRRHRLLMGTVCATALAVCALALAVLPKTYRAETKLLAQRNQVMAAIGNPGRSMPGEFDAPTRAAAETILNHDNLESLIRQTNLLVRWDETRAPAVRVKDWLLRSISSRTMPEEEKVDALIFLLEKKLAVQTAEGTVTISVEWNDAQLAYRLVEAAQQNFLEARHVSEISTIVESISILESHAAAVAEQINAEIEEVQRAREAKAKGKPAASSVPARPAQSQELLQMRLMLIAKRRAIADLEEFRRKRLAELQAELARQRAVYAEQHPLVQDTQQTIDALLKDSPQIAALRREDRELAQEFLRRGGKLDSLERESNEVGALQRLESGEAQRAMIAQPDVQEDPSLGALRNRLQFAMQKYNGLTDRIDSARLELDTARAAFKYRYSVIRPAQVPKVPEKPRPASVMIAGLIAGLVLGVLGSVALDIASGLVFERWQIERSLGLPVLAVVKKP
jgi:uncharacterized protein involved in exopolysaccharide biosynthesis